MTLVLVPVGRGNWKTRVELKYSGPGAPGPLAFGLGQRMELPTGDGLSALWRVVEIRA